MNPTAPRSALEATIAFLLKLAMIALLALLIVQLAIVLARHGMGWSAPWAGELATFFHAGIIALTAASTLVAGRHVRIDAVSSRWSDSTRQSIDRWGTGVLLAPLMVVILVSAFPYVAASWSILEGSAEISGLPGLFLLKTLLPVFAASMLVAGVLLWRRSA